MKTLMANINTRLEEIREETLIGEIGNSGITVHSRSSEQEQLHKLLSSIQHLLKYVEYVGVDKYTDWDWELRLEEHLNTLSLESQLTYLNDVTKRAAEMECIKNSTSGDCKGIDWFNMSAEVLRDLAMQARHAAFY